MLCDECGKNEAVFYSRQQVGTHTTERHLCAACQKKHADGLLKMHGLDNVFSTLSDYWGMPQQRGEEHVCLFCGTTANEFLQTGFVGCAHCYDEFASLMLPAIKQMQGATSHVGKVPSEVEDSVAAEYDRLNIRLKRAVATEDFETAAVLKEQIKRLKGE